MKSQEENAADGFCKIFYYLKPMNDGFDVQINLYHF